MLSAVFSSVHSFPTQIYFRQSTLASWDFVRPTSHDLPFRDRRKLQLAFLDSYSYSIDSYSLYIPPIPYIIHIPYIHYSYFPFLFSFSSIRISPNSFLFTLNHFHFILSFLFIFLFPFPLALLFLFLPFNISSFFFFI